MKAQSRGGDQAATAPKFGARQTAIQSFRGFSRGQVGHRTSDTDCAEIAIELNLTGRNADDWQNGHGTVSQAFGTYVWFFSVSVVAMNPWVSTAAPGGKSSAVTKRG